MNTERVVSALLLLACVYGGVWAAVMQPSLLWLFGALTLLAFWTVTEVWFQVEVSEPDQG